MSPASTRLALALLAAALAVACSDGSEARGEGSANIAECGDGADNDGDGQIDCADPDCADRTCRAAVGGCDEPEACTAGACPDDVLSPGGKVCRARASAEEVCDAEELCDGASAACPDDAVMPAATPCRDAVDLCDVEEQCDGVAKTCPQDAVEPAGVPCRPVLADSCAAAGSCDGSSVSCPQGVLPAGTPCRKAAGGCDLISEFCDGASDACPADQGNCAADQYCAGTTCAPKKATGSACRARDECQSGYCVDGLCCGSACTGTCRACNVQYHEGSCEPLVSVDPSNECGRYLCGGSSCYGYCVTGAAGGDCGERYCDSGSYCKDERCIARQPNGTMCLSHCQCASNHCVLFFCVNL